MNEHEIKTDNYHITIREVDGELKVSANRIINGEVRLPLAYMLGMNYLIFKKRFVKDG